MALRNEIWCQKIAERLFVYDADEIKRLAVDRQRLRKAGRLGGRRPGSGKAAD